MCRTNKILFPVLRIRIRMFMGLPDLHPDPLYRGTDPLIRIRIKMSRIHNTGCFIELFPDKDILLQVWIRHVKVTSSGSGLDMDPDQVTDL
jgi:hypothetical protein